MNINPLRWITTIFEYVVGVANPASAILTTAE